MIAFTLLFSFPLPTFAAESNDRQQNTSFEISLEEALALADPADITVQNGITTIPVKLDIQQAAFAQNLQHTWLLQWLLHQKPESYSS